MADLSQLGEKLLDLMHQIEEKHSYDAVTDSVDHRLDRLLSGGKTREVLRGEWLGHALHPVLTDFPLGAWTATSFLDLFGNEEMRSAAQRLNAFGLAAAIPTAMTGAADYSSGGKEDRRVALVHAAVNSAAFCFYGLSYLQRRKDRHKSAVALGIVGGIVATAGGYLGGHLSLVRGMGLPELPVDPRRT